MNKQEAIEKIKNIDTLNINDMVTGQQVDMVIKNQVLDIISQIDEPQKPVIPKFVAEYIELNKSWSEDGQECIEVDNSELWFALNGDNQGMPNSVSDWLFNEEKVETFAKAWLNGYEIEQEPLYTVEIPKLGGGGMNKDSKGFSFYTVKAQHKNFILEKKIESENQYNAVIDFISELSVLFDYNLVDEFRDDILILSVEQGVE
jgi:hypothetical protein